MTEQQFAGQMSRLTEVFGKQSFGTERAALVWQQVRELEAGWFRGVVDGFIGECRQAPLVSDFSGAVAEERERRWRIEKAQNAKEAKEFFQGSFSDDDRSMLLQGIIKRLRGQMAGPEWTAFTGMLDQTIKLTHKARCGVCHEAGVIFRGDEQGAVSVCRCTCEAGQRDRRNYPVVGAR